MTCILSLARVRLGSHCGISRPLLFSIRRCRSTASKFTPRTTLQDVERQVEELDDMVDFPELTSKELNYSSLTNAAIRDNVVADVKRQQKKLLRQILHKKMMKKEQEPNLLTWDAKQQIRFLNNEDSEYWDPQRLSESFPISRDGVIRILKSKYKLGSVEEIVKHDQIVSERWKKLHGKPGPHSQYKHLLEHASGNKNLPSNTQKLLPMNPWENPKRTPGIFESIIINYRKNLPNTAERQLAKTEDQYKELTSENDALLKSITKSASKREAHKMKVRLKASKTSEDDLHQNKMKKYNETKRTSFDYKDPYLSTTTATAQQPIEKNINSDSSHQKDYKKAVSLETANVVSQVSNVELYEYDADAWRVKAEDDQHQVSTTIRYENQSEAYMYDDEKGYQYPYGRADIETEPLAKHKLPKGQKPNSTLKSGDSYYDDDGEFLYRVP